MQTHIPVFGYQGAAPRHNTFSTGPVSGSSSYLGFHRPTRVIPPTSSHSSGSKSSSSPSSFYYPQPARGQPWFMGQPTYRRFDKPGVVNINIVSWM